MVIATSNGEEGEIWLRLFILIIAILGDNISIWSLIKIGPNCGKHGT